MCTYSRQTKPYIASRDMKVIKYLQKVDNIYRTPYQGTEVSLNTIIRPEKDSVESNKSYYGNSEFTSGVIHSCLTTRLRREGNSIHVAIIPKGSKYWIGSNGEDICSDSLIITDETVTAKPYMFKETAEELMSNAPSGVGTIKDDLVLVGYNNNKPLYACYNNIIENVAIDTDYNSSITNNFITEECKALEDYNGLDNTKYLRNLKGDRYQLSKVLQNVKDNYYVPALGEIHQLAINLPFINAAFALIDKEPPFPFTWYWTSTEYSVRYSWDLGLREGYPRWDWGYKGFQGSFVLFANFKETTNKEMNANELTKDTIYVEIERMAKAFRTSINSMPDKARSSIGKESL